MSVKNEDKLKDHIEAAEDALEKMEEWKQTALAELNEAKNKFEE